MKKLRLLLLPFSWIYGCIAGVRNFLYEKGIKKRYFIAEKSICVGNLSVGGTGKTPHVAYLADFFIRENIPVTILSRGYGRKTKGFILADANATSEQIGDEPMLYVNNFPDATVAVCEQRKAGIERLNELQKNQLFLLDDAFQHRAVQAGFSILLTDFSDPYFSDHVLPAGNLREWKCGKKRADLVVVTKSPHNLDEQLKKKYLKKLGFKASGVYFSSIAYGPLVPFHDEIKQSFKKVLLVTGIANPTPLEEHLAAKFEVCTLKYPDHHNFSPEDIEKIHKKFDTFAKEKETVIITTEKDFVRLMQPQLKKKTQERPWFYQRISLKIDREEDFKRKIKDYVRTI